LDTICMDLMMYENDELFELALSFMRRRFGQRRAALQFLPKVTILNTSKLPVFTDFSILDQEIQQLRFHMKSYDVWGVAGVNSPMDETTYLSVKKALTNLVDFIYSESLAVEDDKKERENSRERRIVGYREIEMRGVSNTGEKTSDMHNKAPSVVFAQEKRVPNKQYQDLMRNMGMAREVLFHGVAIKYDIMMKMRQMKTTEEPSSDVKQKEKRSEEVSD